MVRSRASFDREVKNEYYITVIAEDGAPSNRSNHFPPGTPNRGVECAFLALLLLLDINEYKRRGIKVCNDAP